jgi:tetratricopeptide (TPR) repeat protein
VLVGGEAVDSPLVVDYYRRLPERSGEDTDAWLVRLHSAINTFKKQVAKRYTEGTLQHLLESANAETRQAAVLALGLLGTIGSNTRLAACLYDEDEKARELAANALWAVWFRGDSEDNAQELQRLVRLKDRGKALAGLDALIARAPSFAEAFNQRAILFYQMRYFEKSIADCERVLALNPHHFGAQVGMAQCLLQLGRQRAALKAFRRAMKLHPELPGVAETIRALKEALDGGRDDKK